MCVDMGLITSSPFISDVSVCIILLMIINRNETFRHDMGHIADFRNPTSVVF